MNAIKSAVVFLCAAFFVIACQSTTPNSANLPTRGESPKQTATVDVIAEGNEIFATNCMICHKKDGTGGPATIGGKKINAEDLTTDKMKLMTDEKLIEYVTNGIVDEGMPAFKDKLSDDEIKMAVAHVRRLQGP